MPTAFSDDRPQIAVTLRDGSVARLGPLVGEDRDLLLEGLAGLSAESLVARFGRAALTDAELDYLVDVDHRNHVAWGAVIDDEAAGVGRYIVDPDRGCAEIAITVIDRFQGRGLARILFDVLAAVARGDGVEELCFAIQPDNEPVLRILQGIDTTLDAEGELVVGRIPLADVPGGSIDEAVLEVMARVRG